MNRKAFVNKYIIVYIIFLCLLMLGIGTWDMMKQNQTMVTVIGALGMIIFLILAALVYRKKPESDLVVYILVVTVAFPYTAIMLVTSIPQLFIFSFLANVCVILLYKTTLNIISNLAIIVTNTVIFIMRIKNGLNTLYSGVFFIILTVSFSICWIWILRLLIKFAREDEETISLQKQEQLTKITSLEGSSKKMGETIHNISQLSSEVQENMQETKDVIENISTSTYDTAESIQMQNELTEEVQYIINDLKKMVTNVQMKVKKTVSVSDEGHVVMQNLSSQTDTIVSDSENIVTKTMDLSHEVENIKGITETITQITESTNLLALNASIEAARAGEAGRGFAIVADEIRQLADNTQDATLQIDRVLDNFISSISEVVQMVKETAVNIGNEAKLMEEVNLLFSNIGNELNESHDMAIELNEKSDNLIVSNEKIVEQINTLSGLSQEVSAQSRSTVDLQEKSYEAFKRMAGEITDLEFRVNSLC